MGADAKTAMKVDMTEAAAKRIAKIVSGQAGKTALRVSVEGGGCSGFSYKFDLVDTRNDDDVAIEKDGATVLIDDLSLVYMGGSVIDFVDDLTNFRPQFQTEKKLFGLRLYFTSESR